MATRIRAGLTAAVAVSLFALCSPQRAASQPGELRLSAEVECNKPCQDKMRRLENQVRSLQREVLQLRAEVDRLRGSDLPPIAELVKEQPGQPKCEVPYAVDTNGIKRFRPECLNAATLALHADCTSNPYIKRADGVKTIRPECLQ